jgi:hypothetical protein
MLVGLGIAVEDGRGRAGMEVGQCLGGLVRAPQASGQGDVPSVVTANEMEQRAVRDELVHQHGDFEAAAEELDDFLWLTCDRISISLLNSFCCSSMVMHLFTATCTLWLCFFRTPL